MLARTEQGEGLAMWPFSRKLDQNRIEMRLQSVNLYRRHGAVVLPPAEEGGHSDHCISL